MYLYRIIFFIILIAYGNINCNAWHKNNLQNLAVIVKPVIDVVGQPLQPLSPNYYAKKLYDSFAFAPQHGTYACMRLHQLIFNEIVQIEEVRGKEAKCKVFNLFYYDNKNKKQNVFWLLKDTIIYLKDLWNKKIDLSAFPLPYSCDNLINCNKNVVTLSWPWFDKKTKKCYSAGTRFVHVGKKDTQKSYAVKIFDINNYSINISYIPRNLAIIHYQKNKDQYLNLFIKLLKKWTNSRQGIMYYVWGGCSFTKLWKTDTFELVSSVNFKEKVTFWQRPNVKNKPYTGCECSTLILRIAQIIGMPYFCKNTTALANTLKPLCKTDTIENGDLIWYKGHVLVASDITKNLAIEDVGYQNGYGCLIELSLSRIFKNIKTYKDLIQAHLLQQPLERLNKAGNSIKSIKIKLFKMRSIWSIQKF